MFLSQIIVVIFLLLQRQPLIQAKWDRKKEPTHYFIYGDKFSGVDFSSRLFSNAKPSLPLQECKIQPNISPDWKYGPFTWNEARSALNCDTDSTIFLLVTKDPYSWLTSVARRLYRHSKGKDGMRSHLHLLIMQREQINKLGLGSDSNRKVSVLRERTKKLKSHLAIVSKARFSSILRYEDLLQNPDYYIKQAIKGRHNDTIGGFYIPNTAIDDKKKTYYLNQTYISDLTNRGIQRSLNILDKRIESKLGYRLPPRDDYLSSRDIFMRTQRKENIFMYIFHIAFDVLWWIVVPTMVLLFCILPIILIQKTDRLMSGNLNMKHE